MKETEKTRFLSDVKISKNNDSFLFYEDKNKNRPPEEFFDFVRYSKNTRKRLLSTNKDIFIIHGQNMFFALLVIFTYLSVWLIGLGDRPGKVIQTYIKI